MKCILKSDTFQLNKSLPINRLFQYTVPNYLPFVTYESIKDRIFWEYNWRHFPNFYSIILSHWTYRNCRYSFNQIQI